MTITDCYALVIKNNFDEVIGVCMNYPGDNTLYLVDINKVNNEDETRIITLFRSSEHAIRSFNGRASKSFSSEVSFADELVNSLGIKLNYKNTTTALLNFTSIKPFIKPEKFDLWLERR